MSAPQPLKIAFILTPPFDPNSGGVQMSTWKMSSFFIECGHNVGVFSFSAEGHHVLPKCKFGKAPDPGGVQSPINLDSLRKFVIDFKPHIVINQMPYEHAIGTILSGRNEYVLLGCLRNTLFSVISDINGFIDRAFPVVVRKVLKNSVGRSLLKTIHRHRHRVDLKKILSTYDRFVMFAPPNLKELSYFLPRFEPSKVALIPNSIPAVCNDLPNKEKRILWLGRLEEKQKRASLILPIWEKVSSRLPGWRLDVVGDGPSMENLKRDVKEMGIEGIEFHGRQNPDGFYRRSAIFFMTSAFEGFPNTLVEAKSFGCVPLVFDTYPMASWLIRQNVDGLLIPPFEVESMASRIVELALDSDCRDKMAQASLDSVRQFEIQHVGKQWEALFEEEWSKRACQDGNKNLDSETTPDHLA